ncbi:hypothetical protein SO802_003286 [Lithocarpus litseifolius]|uniref:TMEM205-like domain-containing protein n=1 Tax=Lithocarpus litseifolius TaxID=425828 RepID=A0AAW2E2C9_9ROSI
MMNLLALCLVVTSLVSAGVWSPTPPSPAEEDVIVKDGHRVIVVEYEYDQGDHPNTKVSISPEQQHQHHETPPNPMEKIKEASSVLPNLGQGLSQPSEKTTTTTPKELICDAFGKCKHRIASAMGKAKDKVSETAHEAIDKTKDTTHEAIAKEKEMAHEMGDAVGDALGKAKETAKKKAREVEEGAKERAEDVMEKAKAGKDKGKTIGKGIARDVSDKVEMAKEEVVEKAKVTKERVKSGADKLKRESQKEVGGAIRRGLEVGHGALNYATSPALMGVMNLLGLATAYGMCVWVTFISSYVLAETIPRQQFGLVQSKIYPVYFRFMAGCIGLALLGHLLGNRRRLLSNKVEMFQTYNLLASLFMVFVNSIYLEPRATKVMFERMKLQKEEGRGREELTAEPRQVSESSQPVAAEPGASTKTSTTAPAVSSPAALEHEVVRSRIVSLNDRLKKLNSYSSFLNILTLMALSWNLVYLGQRLHLTC